MFIEEKYLITPNSTGVAGSGETATILTCKYCHREFMLPDEVADKLEVKDVCEATECKAAYERAEMASKLAAAKADSSDVDAVKKALAD